MCACVYAQRIYAYAYTYIHSCIRLCTYVICCCSVFCFRERGRTTVSVSEHDEEKKNKNKKKHLVIDITDKNSDLWQLAICMRPWERVRLQKERLCVDKDFIF